MLLYILIQSCKALERRLQKNKAQVFSVGSIAANTTSTILVGLVDLVLCGACAFKQKKYSMQTIQYKQRYKVLFAARKNSW